MVISVNSRKNNTMKKFLLIASLFLISCSGNDPNPCLMPEDFIKQTLSYPNEASFPFTECHVQDKSGNVFTIIRKVKTKNAFGMVKSYIYKVKLEYNGGISTDSDNWSLVDIKWEEYTQK